MKISIGIKPLKTLIAVLVIPKLHSICNVKQCNRAECADACDIISTRFSSKLFCFSCDPAKVHDQSTGLRSKYLCEVLYLSSNNSFAHYFKIYRSNYILFAKHFEKSFLNLKTVASCVIYFSSLRLVIPYLMAILQYLFKQSCIFFLFPYFSKKYCRECVLLLLLIS